MAYTKEGTDGQILRSSKWIVIVIMIFEKKVIHSQNTSKKNSRNKLSVSKSVGSCIRYRLFFS